MVFLICFLGRHVIIPVKIICDICTIILDITSKSSANLRVEQINLVELKKIIKSFEYEEKSVESEEAQLVVHTHESGDILKEHHD